MGYVAGGSYATLQELQKDLEKSQKEANIKQCSSAFTNAGQIWDGYMDLLRAQGFCVQLQNSRIDDKKNNGEQLFQNDQNSELLMIIQKVNDLLLKIKVKIQEPQQKITDYVYVTGFNENCGLGQIDYKLLRDKEAQVISQIRNRQIFSLAVGDEHVLILVSGCICQNLYDPRYDCQGVYECNGGPEVFAWGSNTKGQVNGFISEKYKTINTPNIITQLSGKEIKSNYDQK
ncbi:Regulator of chromosome condensation 1/beta-lactamase-inhibitor protein II [Pseudocohnilembus persalinus]|uniref:Regulator of chromosome condensation 1/beta-lactamase-inhibitor protein II n=1 Tax=Pseudocohnilembus persalinus TaxID=266149 RepID=A0A0V0QCM6_PSEPJ|nr:Regulator of chromosome condensation 1/beta-lactamase-inhibitor protein II [Pseudocohnilembus persalinus]|eukprot:KRW99952.1 Regulator of chromosome condensation 1/beta-lactamase-inhibitor protein II [Pseudocohnilembus persalinus]